MDQTGRMTRFSPHTNYYRYLRELRKNQWLKTHELERIQQKKLRAIINHAYRNVPFYHKLFDSVGVKPEDIKTIDDLLKVPTITKEQLQQAGNEIIARSVNINNCVKNRTSGSTGVPLTLFFSKKDLNYARASYDLARTENGFRLFRDSLLSVSTPHFFPQKGKKWYQYLGIMRWGYINLYDNIDIQVSYFKKCHPDAIWGFPSCIKLLAKAIQERGLEVIAPRLVFTASELLDPRTRNLINSAFNVDPIDVYGSYETGCMAWECSSHSGYHMNINTVMMEFIDRDGERVVAGESGEVVVTNLHSYAMPFIRYKIGDIGTPSGEQCPCGRGLPLMELVEGRMDDFLVLPSGKIISPRNINLLEYAPGIANYKVIQEKRDKITVQLVKAKDFSQDTITSIKEIITCGLLDEEINIEVEIVDEIPRDPSGKIRAVISKVQMHK